jgi:hypothetical protein
MTKFLIAQALARSFSVRGRAARVAWETEDPVVSMVLGSLTDSWNVIMRVTGGTRKLRKPWSEDRLGRTIWELGKWKLWDRKGLPVN